MPRLVVTLVAIVLLFPPGLRAQQTPESRNSQPPPSSLVNGVYRNPTFGFSYRPPYGWVERTAEMQEDDTSSGKSPDPKTSNAPKTPTPQLLLAVFERPPDARGDTINSAVIIAAESAKSYPGLKSAADYFTVVEDGAKSQGFEIAHEPYEFSVGSRTIAREDFGKTLGSLPMKQSTLVILQKGFLVSFTVVAGSDDEISSLIEGLNFTAARPASPGTSSSRKK